MFFKEKSITVHKTLGSIYAQMLQHAEERRRKGRRRGRRQSETRAEKERNRKRRRSRGTAVRKKRERQARVTARTDATRPPALPLQVQTAKDKER